MDRWVAVLVSLTLLIGGARSGKSALAERLASATHRPVVYVATMEPRDAEVVARIQSHRAARPVSWVTVGSPRDVLEAARIAAPGDECVLIDCLTMWTSNLLLGALAGRDDPSPRDAELAIDVFLERARTLGDWACARAGETIIVTNEVGSGVVPAYALGRIFRDALGRANALMAGRAECVYAVTAGLALELRSAGAVPIDALGESPTP